MQYAEMQKYCKCTCLSELHTSSLLRTTIIRQYISDTTKSAQKPIYFIIILICNKYFLAEKIKILSNLGKNTNVRN